MEMNYNQFLEQREKQEWLPWQKPVLRSKLYIYLCITIWRFEVQFIKKGNTDIECMITYKISTKLLSNIKNNDVFLIFQQVMSEKEVTKSESYVDIDSPRWDQSTYIGRAKHFFTATNPLNVFASSADLQSAKDVIEQHRKVQNMHYVREETK